MFKQILVGIDGSECSLDAARAAVRLARVHDAALTILHVCPLPEVPKPFPGAPGFAEDLMERYVHDLHNAVLARLKATLAGEPHLTEDISYDIMVEAGNPVDVITRIADTRGYDLIVLGTHARTMEKVAELGSVSHGVLCRAHTTVMVVRSR